MKKLFCLLALSLISITNASEFIENMQACAAFAALPSALITQSPYAMTAINLSYPLYKSGQQALRIASCYKKGITQVYADDYKNSPRIQNILSPKRYNAVNHGDACPAVIDNTNDVDRAIANIKKQDKASLWAREIGVQCAWLGLTAFMGYGTYLITNAIK